MVFMLSFSCQDKNPFPNGMADIVKDEHCDPVCDAQIADPTQRCCEANEKPKSLDPESDCHDWRFQGKIDDKGKCQHLDTPEKTDPAKMFDNTPPVSTPPVFDGKLSAQMLKVSLYLYIISPILYIRLFENIQTELQCS